MAWPVVEPVGPVDSLARNKANTATTSAAAALAAANAAQSTANSALAATKVKTVELLVTDPNGNALTTGDGKCYFRVPASLNGATLSAVAAHVTTVSSSGLPTVQIANVTTGFDMLSTKVTIDANEKDSSTAVTAAVIDTAHDDVATADELRIDVDVAGTGAKGLIVVMQFQLP